ncbi:uncharacterized protein DUF4362 [Paenibacillus cellulosilyticus]|uniref:Uncharacterized protein DUF4362 n=1 Tax=Paenibacillus cellulosilyticus TaxID=375489 RepID=A0A2V2YDF7_9BACL|nr:DUF4362 domain-containing protein [Paenibacillus cellulosilyticus]PWV88437.1 uncharacterized protein DUF4362 [Paenibacillus cellulosilyticus]QKS44296.1 DUF4362 domain-containing protein [Paenibacillus cellulosilyticus]
MIKWFLSLSLFFTLARCDGAPSQQLGPLPAMSEALSYTTEKALANGDVVQPIDKLFGLEHWERFYSNYKLGTPDQVRITTYTLEGAPIFYDLVYDGGNTITYTFDNTLDSFGSPQRVSTTCRSIVTDSKVQNGESYRLSNCKDDLIRQTFRFSIDDVLPIPSYLRD